MSHTNPCGISTLLRSFITCYLRAHLERGVPGLFWRFAGDKGHRSRGFYFWWQKRRSRSFSAGTRTGRFPPGPQRRVPPERGRGAARSSTAPPAIAPATATAPRPTKNDPIRGGRNPPRRGDSFAGSPRPARSLPQRQEGFPARVLLLKEGGGRRGKKKEAPPPSTTKKQLAIAPESTVCSDPPLPAHLPRPKRAASGVINPFVSAQPRRWLSSSGQRFTCGNITSIPQPNHMHKGKQSCIKHGIYCLLASLLFLKSPLTGPNNCTFRLKEERGEEEKKLRARTSCGLGISSSCNVHSYRSALGMEKPHTKPVP